MIMGNNARQGIIFNVVVGIIYGCGRGTEAIGLVKQGAQRVIGIDTRDKAQDLAREDAGKAAVSHLCAFLNPEQDRQALSEMPKADVILSLDAFEHYDNPGGVLQQMRNLFEPGIYYFGGALHAGGTLMLSAVRFDPDTYPSA